MSQNTLQELRLELKQLEHRRQGIKALLPLYRHHWKLPPPNGPILVGTCSCGAEKSMANSDEAITSLQEAHE